MERRKRPSGKKCLKKQGLSGRKKVSLFIFPCNHSLSNFYFFCLFLFIFLKKESKRKQALKLLSSFTSMNEGEEDGKGAATTTKRGVRRSKTFSQRMSTGSEFSLLWNHWLIVPSFLIQNRSLTKMPFPPLSVERNQKKRRNSQKKQNQAQVGNHQPP